MKYHQRRSQSHSQRVIYYKSYLERLKVIRTRSLSNPEETRITIIGAGMAGLVSAYELERLGFCVIILEAEKTHVGGRVRTHRDQDGCYGELGAMRVPQEHSLTRHYIQEFSLHTRKFIQSSDDTFANIRSKQVKRSEEGIESLKDQFEMTKAELAMTADDMWARAVIDVLDNLTKEERDDLYAKSFSTTRIRDFDNMTLLMAMQKAGLSKGAIEYVSSVYGVSTYLNTAFTEHLREELEEVWVSEFDEIVGGTDLLPRKIFEAIKSPLRRSARVSKINVNDHSVRIDYIDKDGNEATEDSDWLICTVPFGVLSTIEFTGAVSDELKWGINQVHYDSSTKILIRCKKRFWELNDGIYGGGSIWDGGLGHTWYPSDNADARDETVSNAPSYLLASYTWGQHAQRIDTIPNSQLKGYVIEELAKIHPALDPNDIEKVVRWSWTEYPYSSGAFAFFNSGDQTLHYNDMKRIDGRLLLAGEHCSLTHSWIQGAIESSVDAMEAILQQNS